MSWPTILVLVIAVALVAWVAAAVVVRRNRPSRELAVPAVRILPDIVVLARRLSAEPAVPRRLRFGLAILRAWLVSPIDLIPDFLPVVGNLDDLVMAVALLRRVVPHVERQRLAELWPGTPEGLALFERLLAESRAVQPA